MRVNHATWRAPTHRGSSEQKLYRRPHSRRLTPILVSVLSSILRSLSDLVDAIATVDKEAICHPVQSRCCLCYNCTRHIAADFEAFEFRNNRKSRAAHPVRQMPATSSALGAPTMTSDKLDGVSERAKATLNRLARRFKLSGKRLVRRNMMKSIATEAVDVIAALLHRFQGLDHDCTR